jgi:hypothetical protein
MPLTPNISRNKSLSRYNYGVIYQEHKGVTTSTAVGTPYFDNFNPINANPREYKLGRLPLQFSHRPDLISHAFYNTPGYWWYIMQLNNITDPFESLNSAELLIFPKP